MKELSLVDLMGITWWFSSHKRRWKSSKWSSREWEAKQPRNRHSCRLSRLWACRFQCLLSPGPRGISRRWQTSERIWSPCKDCSIIPIPDSSHNSIHLKLLQSEVGVSSDFGSGWNEQKADSEVSQSPDDPIDVRKQVVSIQEHLHNYGHNLNDRNPKGKHLKWQTPRLAKSPQDAQGNSYQEQKGESRNEKRPESHLKLNLVKENLEMRYMRQVIVSIPVGISKSLRDSLEHFSMIVKFPIKNILVPLGNI